MVLHILHYLKEWSCLHLHLFRDLQGVVHLHAQVPDGTLQLGASQQKLNGSRSVADPGHYPSTNPEAADRSCA